MIPMIVYIVGNIRQKIFVLGRHGGLPLQFGGKFAGRKALRPYKSMGWFTYGSTFVGRHFMCRLFGGG